MPIKNQIKCGLHVSIAKGIDLAVDRAKEKTCNTFQIFTSNPRNWRSRPLNINEITKFNEKLHKYEMNPVFSHIPYLPNFSSPYSLIKSSDKQKSPIKVECKARFATSTKTMFVLSNKFKLPNAFRANIVVRAPPAAPISNKIIFFFFHVKINIVFQIIKNKST